MRTRARRNGALAVVLIAAACSGSDGNSPTQPPNPNPTPTGLLSVSFEVEATAVASQVVLLGFRETVDGAGIGVTSSCLSGSTLFCNSLKLSATKSSVAPGQHTFGLVLIGARCDLMACPGPVAISIRGSYRVTAQDTGAFVRTVALPDRLVTLDDGKGTVYQIEVAP